MINFIDVGCGYNKDIVKPWNKNKKYINFFLGFDPYLKQTRKIKFKKFGIKYRLYKYVIFDEVEEGHNLKYNKLAKPNSSSLFSINNKVLKEIGKKKERYRTKKIKKIKWVRLDFMINKLGRHFDFIKIDTQGAELNVLKSLGKYLEKDIIGIHIELFFKKMYKNIPLYEEVDGFLRKHNFYQAKVIGIGNSFVNDFLYIRDDKNEKDKIDLIKKVYEIK